MNAISLFSGAGIGDIGLRAAGFNFLGFCELEGDRLQLTETNFEGAKFFVGDIWKTHLEVIDFFSNTKIDLITCTAPCQGMSKNGQGTLLKNIREGRRPKLDPRNRLIIPALEIIKRLKPQFIIFENVSEMRRTYIEGVDNKIISILDLIRSQLGDEYVGKAYDVEFANYGVPQRRQRLITVYSRNAFHRKFFSEGYELIPPETHAKTPEIGKKKWISVTDAISYFPPLDAATKVLSEHAMINFHRVPLLDEKKYFWVEHTPLGKSAFDNQCVSCGWDQNPIHATGRNKSGVNQASKTTPINCVKCGSLLPRPTASNPDGTLRIMSGFTSAYKRMAPDLPSPTLTRNFSYACSDSKLHPTQNRVLSIAEALAIHTMSDYPYKWIRRQSDRDILASDALIRLVIGESIPPKFMEILGRYLITTSTGEMQDHYIPRVQRNLFSHVH
jgi:DNA (cytosine-5)-methyltransferase 1